MYFCLVQALGIHSDAFTLPPAVALASSPVAAEDKGNAIGATGELGGSALAPVADSGVTVSAVAAIREDGGKGDGEEPDELEGEEGEQQQQQPLVADSGGVVEESRRDQVFNFWDEKANGQLVQAPLDLDWQGRGWSKVCVVCFNVPHIPIPLRVRGLVM